MKYYSTNQQSSDATLREAVLRGLPPDNGLYMPYSIPRLSPDFIEGMSSLSFPEIAVEVMAALLDAELPQDVLREMTEEAINFDAPLVQLDEHLHVLELFHGPTLAFKDFAARFMARLMGYYVRNSDEELTILVATSGDTGSAVANGFVGVAGIRVFILYPSGRVSPLQEKQLTTLGENITALEIDGSFDDCQAMVKSAFLDETLGTHYRLTSANSINIARLLPQTLYYFRAVAQIRKQALPIVMSVPSGNFGNLTAGLIARKMGLPIYHFIAATNINDIVPRYLASGLFDPQVSRSTISNAMDVGNPSNFQRLLALYDGDFAAIRKDVSGFSATDDETRETMQGIYQHFDYVADPHGAVGYRALQQFRAFGQKAMCGIFLETAHPAKFDTVVEETLGIKVDIPAALSSLAKRQKVATSLPANFSALKEFLL